MKRKNKIGIILVIATLLLSTTFVAATIEKNQTTDQGEICFEKQVWRQPLQGEGWWDEYTEAKIGDTVRFKITLTYYGESLLHHIKIIDYLPDDLHYVDNVTITNAPDIEPEINENILTWNFSAMDPLLQDGENISIEFDAEVITNIIIENVNTATVTASECNIFDHSDEDQATVMVEEDQEEIEVDKQVWNGTAWAESIKNVGKGDILQFKITVTYYGPNSIKCMIIHDQLPDECLEYDENFTITLSTTGIADFPNVDISEDKKDIFFNWTRNENLFLQDGETVSIKYAVKIVCYCEETIYNKAYAWAWGCFPCETILEGCDKVAITCEVPEPKFIKQVWNENEWAEETFQIIGRTVRFKLNLTYYGKYHLSNITILDYLPCTLEYTGNANIKETNISEDKKTIWWNLTNLTLSDQETLIIEFDALVVAPSGCEGAINTAKASGLIVIETPMYTIFETEDTAKVISRENNPPSRPIIDGDTKGKRNKDLNFYILADNYEEEDVWYYIDWGDETNSGWIGPYEQGEQIIITHSFSKRGTYTVKVKAKDIYDAETQWSNEHQVKIKILLLSTTEQSTEQPIAN